MNTLTDAEFEELKRRLNTAIHEIVFAVQHLEQDDTDDALTCLTTAGGTLEDVANEVASKEAK